MVAFVRDGGTLVAFQDVTDSVNVERALREGNDALVKADKLKLDVNPVSGIEIDKLVLPGIGELGD